MIANTSVDVQELTLNKIRLIYLRKAILDDAGNTWLPINLPVSHDLRKEFSESLLNMRPDQLEYYWNDMYFQGINPPTILKSEEAVKRFVAITPNAIGYVNKRNINKDVKDLKIINLPILR